ncbi:Asp-tRNA(Asn)/Glu-tRNA(Gln) amidotransferase subunit GatC [candidate division WWE3 bacterium]|uniref:Asp-tRNA(Asn)/Glu-tRNA(Gln) amidotransferase subunit GatC n=1 Tax=candidate division WWE3 bacterium TaxID=2053526 RepID=A0A7X9HSN4_UNCKA|nr:Asp-tRNA(Asn)/Glu-tRNA(Gln) amidotransferase subunit GatC [candidate division WWE3 bacterium]
MAENIISKDEVEKIAELSNLDVNGQEDKLSKMLSETVKYVENLNELNTSNTPITYQVTGLTNVFQNAEGKSQTLTKKEALSNAKEEKDGLFSTKAVFDR